MQIQCWNTNGEEGERREKNKLQEISSKKENLIDEGKNEKIENFFYDEL